MVEAVLGLWAFATLWWAALWLVLTVVVAFIASERGRSGAAYFLLSLFFSPVLAVLFLIAAPDLARKREHERALNDMREGFTAVYKRLDEVSAYLRVANARSVPVFAAAETVAPSPPAAMGHCPGCNRLRGSTVGKCVYCGNTDPVRA